ncbi:MAG: acyl-CoA dehydrogenase family protein [Bdellovibrionales bacterium]|nr:acyl-CoA dehydrogenase family protein [Bdellovibrionales bacterium]
MNIPYKLVKEEEDLLEPLISFSRSELTALCKESHKSETLFPKSIFNRLASLGITGLSLREDVGGINASPSLQASVYDVLARVDLGPAIFCSVHSMVSGLIQRFGNDQQHSQYLCKLASGEMLAAFALSEPQAGSDAKNLSTQMKHSPDGSYLLNGEKCWITSAGAADIYLVFARLAGTSGKEGITALLINKDQQGLTIGPPEKKMGCELSPIGALSFCDAKISESAIIGGVGEGIRIAYAGLTGGRINIAACANGISRTALSATVDYVKQRKAFGQTLADFQGVQFKLAEMKTALDAATLLVADAAERHSRAPADPATRIAAAEAKLFATETAMRITTDAVQLHGAMGYMKETGVEKLMRDAKMLQIVEGANEVQKGIIARSMLDS